MPTNRLVLSFLVLIAAAPALAQPADRDWANCSQKSDDDLQIRGCTRVLERGARESAGNRANALYNRGLAWRRKGDFDRSIADLGASIQFLPDAATYYRRGLSYRGKKDFERALADFDTALRLNEKDRNSFVTNAEIHLARANVWSDRKELDRAIADYDLAIRLDPKNASSYFQRGVAWQSKDDPGRAIPDYDMALALNPADKDDEFRNVDLHYNRGNAWLEKKEFDRAIADYDASLRLEANHPETYYKRALAWFGKDDHARAIADSDVALRLNPDDSSEWVKNADLHLLRARALIGKDDHRLAMPDLDQTIKLSPLSFDGYFLRGYAHYRLGDLAKALDDTTTATRLDEKSSPAWGNRGYLRFLRGDYDRAAADTAEALRLDPQNIDAIITRGAILGRKGDLVSAAAIIREALRLAPDHREGKLHLAEFEKVLAEKTPQLVPPQLVSPPPPKELVAALPPPPKPEAGQLAAVIPPGKRVALVIGNGAYREKGANMPSLANAKNDAEDVAKALKDVGFEVTLGLDLTRTAMEDSLIAFSRAARGADASLIYFAGHGLQHKGVNYLAPVDAVLKDEGDLRRFIVVQTLIDDLQNAKGARILVLDACRDNEAIKQIASLLPAARSAAFGRGLAEVKADGILVAFSTQPGRVAEDGRPSERNSPFAASLLRHMRTPGLELRTMLTRVRTEVLRTTNGDQRPETSDSMEGEFQFVARAE